MTYLALLHFGSDEVFGNFGLWAFLSIGAVSLFGIFIPLTTWLDTRRREREAFYKAETFRRISESSSEGAQAAIGLLREEERFKRIKRLEGIKIGGIINLCVGAAMIVFMRVLMGGGSGSPALVGLIPGFIGIGLLVYAFFLATPIE